MIQHQQLLKDVDELIAKVDVGLASQKQRNQERRSALAIAEQTAKAAQDALDSEVAAFTNSLDSLSIGYLATLSE